MKNINILKWFFAGAFLVLISYNFSVALEQRFETNGDAWEYIHFGVSMAKKGQLGYLNISREELLTDFKENQVGNSLYESTGPTAFRPPVWPFVISGIFLVFGYNLTILIIFKFLLHLLGVFIFYKTLKLLKIKEVMLLIGTFLYGISPAWQLYSRVFLSEPITLFFITLWLYLLIKFLKGGPNWWLQALIAGITVLCHPYYVFLPFSVWLILFLGKQIHLKVFILSAILCTGVISSWIVRNFIVFGTNEVVLTTSSGAVMAKGWNEEVVNLHTNTKGDLADETLVLKNYDFERNKNRDEVERMKLYKDASLHFIKTNPELILPIIWKKLKSAFNPFPETSRPGILETGRWVFQLFSLMALLYIVFFSKGRVVGSLAWGLILSTIGITILTYSGFRFRMPQVGLELLLIIYVLQEFFNKTFQKS